MKNSIKIMLISFAIVSVETLAMNKKETVVEEKEKAELKAIEFPQGIRREEYINLNETEALTCSTFAELIADKAKNNKPFILARVETKAGNKFVVHYFDAHFLNKALFGNYPMRANAGPLQNPINRQPIEVLEYFTIKKGEKLQEINEYLPNVLSNIVVDYEENFKYLCSSTDLFKGSGQEELLNYFYLNSDDNLNLNLVNVLMQQAEKYYFELKDYKKAKASYEKLATSEVKNVNLQTWAIANTNLGDIYYFGRTGAPDYQRAKECCEKAILPEVKNVNLEAWATANFNLGNIYYFGRTGAPDYQKAKEYYERAALPEVKNVNLDLWAIANSNLGNIYYLGKLGSPDYQRAKECYEKATLPEVKNVNLNAWVIANSRLGEIYYLGKTGAPDCQKAKEYYEKSISLEVKNVDLNLWAIANNILGEIYYYGKTGAPDCQKAKEYYEKSISLEVKNVDLNLWAIANNKLGEIYYYGKTGAIDYKKAKECFEKAALPEVKNANLGLWKFAKNKLEEIEKIENKL